MKSPEAYDFWNPREETYFLIGTKSEGFFHLQKSSD